MKTADAILAAETAGENAANDGKPADDNPYRYGTVRYEAWDRGWRRQNSLRFWMRSCRQQEGRTKAAETERKKLVALVRALAERLADQSELLSKRAERAQPG